MLAAGGPKFGQHQRESRSETDGRVHSYKKNDLLFMTMEYKGDTGRSTELRLASALKEML